NCCWINIYNFGFCVCSYSRAVFCLYICMFQEYRKRIDMDSKEADGDDEIDLIQNSKRCLRSNLPLESGMEGFRKKQLFVNLRK
ncbi:hypothetical protein LINPERPRIM_LOCUS27291, partial [Linum perenne]